jgi:hypothetical protein
MLYAALWKQGTETKECSLIHVLVCKHTCTSTQRSKTDVYSLTLRSFSDEANVSMIIDLCLLICCVFQLKYALTITLAFPVIINGKFSSVCVVRYLN